MATKTAFEEASKYLANRMHTVAEVRKRLAEKEFSESEIDDCVNELIGLRYLDDYEYAMRYYEHNVEKKRGSLRAKRELEERGVDKETIKFAYEDFLYENKIDEYAIAVEVAQSTIDGSEMDEKMRAKVARKLQTRGFSTDIIIKVINGKF